jgi:hypothetical protein
LGNTAISFHFANNRFTQVLHSGAQIGFSNERAVANLNADKPACKKYPGILWVEAYSQRRVFWRE